MRKLIISLTAAAMVAGACGGKTDKTHLEKAKFTFIKGNVTVGGKTASLGQAVNKDANVEVKANSMAIIQFSDAASITLKANSTLSIATLATDATGKPVVELSQTSGSSFSKINKGRSAFAIKTPTAVAGVRGTSFELTLGEGKTTYIKLLEGKVALSKNSSVPARTEVIVLEAGQKAEVSEKGITKASEMTESERKNLQALSSVEISENQVTALVPEAVSKYATGETNSAALSEVTDQADKRTLAEIKAKYGRIARIQTKNGKEYVGFFDQHDQKMKIQTVDGEVTVPVASVRKVTPIK